MSAAEDLEDQFVLACEQADNPDAVLRRWADSHPGLAAAFAALAETHRLLARVRPDPEPHPPERLGDFRVLRKIAWGGMGDVYEAIQEPFGRRVAVKVIRPAHVSPAARERFLREQQVLAGLHQTHIVPIFAAGCAGATHYFAMPYLPGLSLRDAVDDRRRPAPPGGSPAPADPFVPALSFRIAAEWVADAAEAIAHAHERGVIHRDLKPANVLVDEGGHVWVLDFGLAGFLDGEGGAGQAPDPGAAAEEGANGPGDLTSPGHSPGTLDYMAPEQLDGRADVRTDVWGLGVILYELLTLRRAFEDQTPSEDEEAGAGDSLRDRRRRELAQPLVPPREIVPRLPRDLEAVCFRCLAIDPVRRYPSARAVADDLRSFLRGEETAARPWGAAERFGRWCRRHPARARSLLAALLLLWAAVLAGATWQLRTENSRNAAKLAREADAQLDLVKRAVSMTAQQKKLADLLGHYQADPGQGREPLRAFLRETQADFNRWFAHPGKAPLVNLLLFDPGGTLLADSLVNYPSEGVNYAARDYCAGLLRDPDRSAVYVSRVYVSYRDEKYKFAVITRVWDGGRCLGLLAATLPIDSRLVGLDMADEPAGAVIACPMDWSYPERHGAPPGRQGEEVIVLDREHSTPGQDPEWVAGQKLERLRGFAHDPGLVQAADAFTGAGCFADYARVGASPLVVILEQPYPWPAGFLLRWYGATLSLGLLLAAAGGWRLYRSRWPSIWRCLRVTCSPRPFGERGRG